MAAVTLDPLHLVVLLGAVQGVVLAGALAARRRNRTANRLLAAAMVAFSIFLASNVYHSAGLESRFPHFFGLGYPMPFLFGPLIYLYAAAAADRSRVLTTRDWLHFAPFIAVVVGALPIYIMDGPGKLAFYERLVAGDRTLLMVIAGPLKYLSGIGYGVATIVLLRGHAERVKASYSHTEHVNLRWLLWLGASAAAIWILAIVVNLVPSLGAGTVDHGDDIVSLTVAVLVYAIGYLGLRQPEVFRYETAEYPVPQEAAPAEAPTGTPIAEAGRYERSGLSNAEAQRLRTRLLATMEQQRPWADSELTLADLATTLGTTPHKLSEVLNSEIGETFYDFVNGYRVRDVQRRIAEGEARSRKMLALALDAGFASKSTFNQVFKKHTGRTPSDFRQTADA